jgi:hypothetical protein
MMPIVDGLGEEFDGRVTALQLDAGQAANARLQAEFGLRGHPSFAVIDEQDRITQRFFGPQTEQLLRQSMEAIATR